MADRIGRNDSCPCGSGKKYKHCCLGKSLERLVEPKERRLVRERLIALALSLKQTPRGAMAWRVFWGPNSGHSAAGPFPEECERLFAEWLCLDYGLDGEEGTPCVVSEHSLATTPAELAYLAELRRTRMHVYEVIAVSPGTRLRLRDLHTGRQLSLPHPRVSRIARQWDLLIGRLPESGEPGIALCDGCTMVLPRTQREPLLAEVEQRRDEFRRKFPDKTPDDFHRTLPPLYFQTWLRAMLGPATPDSAVPSREWVVMEVGYFRKDDGSIHKVATVPKDGQPVKPGRLLDLLPRDPARGRPVGRLGMRWFDGLILVETLLPHRSTAAGMEVLGMVEGDDGPGMLPVPAKPQRREPWAQELGERMQEAQHALYRGWPDRPCTALDGATPRTAAQTDELRPRLVGILRDLANMYLQSLQSTGPMYDPTWMWKELDLSPGGGRQTTRDLPPRLPHETMEVLVPGLKDTVDAVTRKSQAMPDFGPLTILERSALVVDPDVSQFLEAFLAGPEPGVSARAHSRPYRTWMLGHHIECLCNFDVHHRKAFWVDEDLAFMLGLTDLDLEGAQLRLPFSSCSFVFTDRPTLGIAEKLRSEVQSADQTPRLLRTLTAYVTGSAQKDQAWRLHICFLLDALDDEWPFLVTRDLLVEPHARLDAILESHAGGEALESLHPFFSLPPLRQLVHRVINCILYATSAGVEPEHRVPPEEHRRARHSGGNEVPATGEEILYLPGPIRISQQKQAVELGCTTEGNKLLTRFMVRGHWRRAAATYKEQAPRWIQPYWKGPDIATLLERQYRLTP